MWSNNNFLLGLGQGIYKFIPQGDKSKPLMRVNIFSPSS